MSAFTEAALVKKLAELNSSQQSIQTLSLWLIHHRKHHSTIVKTWTRELHNVSESQKLTFMYLANDVIQNSKKKGPEYGKEFSLVLPKVFSHIGDKCTSEKLIGSLGRILNIWEERGVYDSKTIIEYRARLNKEYKETAVVTTVVNEKKTDILPNNKEKLNDKEKRDKRKHEDSKGKIKRLRPVVEHNHVTEDHENELNGDEAHEIPSYMSLGEPPEPEDLIKAIVNIENSASSDAVTRERIASLPQEVSLTSCLTKLQDKDEAKKLQKVVSEVVDLLTDYNGRLAKEMEDRAKLSAMLKNYQAEQKELLAQAEKRLDEYKRKLTTMVGLQKEIKDHLSNLPDLTQLPDVTGGLAPLPSAGDLFNIH